MGRCPCLCGGLIAFFGGIFAEGDMDELEQELKLLLDETKPDSMSLLPEVPSGVVESPGGTGLLDSLPDAPRAPISICEQLQQLTVTDAGRWIRTFLYCQVNKRQFGMFRSFLSSDWQQKKTPTKPVKTPAL